MFVQQSLQPKLPRRRYAGVLYALWNNTVFRRAQNWVSDSDGSRTDNGSEFQSVGPETAKHLWAYLVVLKRGTARSPRTAERSWPRLADSETGEHRSAKYAGAAWCRLLYTRTHTLYVPWLSFSGPRFYTQSNYTTDLTFVWTSAVVRAGQTSHWQSPAVSCAEQKSATRCESELLQDHVSTSAAPLHASYSAQSTGHHITDSRK